MLWSAGLVLKAAHRLKQCSTSKQVESWYSLMLKTNAAQDCFLINQFITACSNYRSVDLAIFAFSQMDHPNVFVYNAVIAAFLNCFRPLEGLRYYVMMLRSDVRPSSYTFPPVVKSCRVLSVAGFGECVHGKILSSGFGLHLHVQTALVDFYSSLGMVVEARKVFDEMLERDGFAWSTMVSAYARAGDLNSARRVFDEMPEKNIAAWNTVIHGYAEAGDMKSAEVLFHKMLRRDVISWTTMINCYCKQELYQEALELFEEMKSSGTRPDDMTMVTVISACAHLGALEKGKEMHLYVMRTKSDIDVYIGSALIDMYAKCGVVERALVVFFKLQEKNLFCWSSVIDGLACHGYAEQALAMFDTMEKEKIEPNRVIFLSVLAACAHAGLVEEGKRRFCEMTSRYGILPVIEHYGCMIDLLSRVGLLEEALVLIRNMKMQPNSIIWGALLGGCKLHKNLKIAQIAVDRLMILEPNNSGYYTLLINMYAEANRWHEVARIRGIMKECRVEKVLPGSSWIEVKKKLHQFAASDNHHPSLNQIYQVLDVLDSQLKLVGYAPHFDLVI
ncbi:basic helix loop helix DNA-binding superfamily protein [Perilla frutescens var. hirtella]|uniref:Basic helix loop helix DNA-binding superfamily protein n=1 Tax=Perilla frutescens var. hirtella TaxID=608512 RepID=A0AAD4IU99_PERFH|nr:basic helix loop helix DNA-binding superfamily protein [Perilla frutescens var. hirtella]